MKNEMLTNSVKRRYILAIVTLYLMSSAFLIGCRDVWAQPNINEFTANPDSADVGEIIQFQWDITGYQQISINFGDSTPLDVSGESNVSHAYTNEGSYDVTITAIDFSGDSTSETINIVIKNNAPLFNVIFNVESDLAYEDDPVEINVTNLIESDVDKVPGVLTYVYDFADGIENRVSTNESSIIHSWENAGVYPVTVTAIDDQGALNQKTKNITIRNKAPIADFIINVSQEYQEEPSGYIATYNWQNCPVNSLPIGWDITNVNPLITSISVVDSGDEIHNKVVRFQDDSDEEGVSMKNSFEGQEFGTIEFWVKSGDISSKTWAMSLWDNSDMAFQILMDDSDWKYTTNTKFSSIFPTFNLDNNIWYHVRIDFCTDNSSGLYYNLNTLQFRTTINDIQSQIFNIDNLNILEINKIKIESSKSDTGTSWIDAIGYSWDPSYQISKNRWPTTIYTDNINFLFDGRNSNDTDSDIDSLRYYWQFGDGTNSFGKNVYHQYSRSGLYTITLMVKDDNGKIDFSKQYLSVQSMDPTLDLINPDSSVIVYEGETIAFETEVWDDANEMVDLAYWWNFEFDDPYFDINSLDSFETGGWKKSHVYMDDYSGLTYVVVKDPGSLTSYSSLGVDVLNVDPSISIWDANIMANCTFLISRSNEEIDANFSIVVLGNEEVAIYQDIDFAQSDNNFINFKLDSVPFSLSKYWKIVINSSSDVPDYSWFKFDIIFKFQNNDMLIITSDKLYGGSIGYWEAELNPFFYDNENNNFKYPLTLNTHVWDPSIDDINLNITYKTNFLLNLSSSLSLPGGYSSTNNYILNDASYSIHVFEQMGSNFANISINQLLASEVYDNNAFPVSLDLQYSIDPLIDYLALFQLIEDDFPLTDVSLIKCLEAKHSLMASVEDDDNGNDSLRINFDTKNGIRFENLSPRLEPSTPEIVSEIRNITLHAYIWDYDQINSLMDAFLISPIDYYNTTIINEIVCNYTLTSNKIPYDMHGFIETSNGTFYLIDSLDRGILLKSIDQGKNWVEVISLSMNYQISSMWYDRNLENLYLACSNSTSIEVVKIGLSDDYLTYSSELNGGNPETLDIVLIGTILYVGMGNSSNGNAYIIFEELDTSNMVWAGSHSIKMGSFNDRIYRISSLVAVNNVIYYLWQWVNENAELWCFNTSNNSFINLNSPEIEKLLINTDILEQPFGGVTHDDSDIISFILENVDYIGSGYYPATYNFKYDDYPNEPDCFEEVGTVGGTVNVISELGGHKAVVELYDNNSGFFPNGQNAHVIKELSSTPDHGTIEYWMRYDTTWKLCGFRIDSGANEIVTMRNLFNVLQYYDGTWHNIRFLQNDTWYHVRVDFECTLGGYQGLSQFTWRLFINNIEYGPFPFTNNEPQGAQIEWYTDYLFGLAYYSYYIDAIGFSWDPQYSIGDNINPTEPGHYPGTYSFRYDDAPNQPDCFEEIGTAGGTVNVRSLIGGHNAVVQLYDYNFLFNAHVIKELPNSTFGTIEYWVRSDYPKLCGFRLDNGAVANEMVTMRIFFNVLQYYNGTDWNNLHWIENKTWYHFRIDFECTTGGYQGLSQFTWRLFVNNITEYGPFQFINNEPQGARVQWYTDQLRLFYSYFIDAIGFSWDPEYRVGDNLNPIESGHYPATYSFEDDFMPNAPDCFEEIVTDGGTINVINVLDGHKKVLQLYDNNIFFQKLYVNKELASTPAFGTIEYWMRSDNPKKCGFRLDNGDVANEFITIRTYYGNLQYLDGNGWHKIQLIEPNRWYHFRIDFECTNGSYHGLSQFTWRFYIDGLRYGDYDFKNNITQASRISWYTDSTVHFMGFYSYYIDAIGFSWDPYYNIGDNKFIESKYHYCTYNISSNTLIKNRQYDKIALMLDRNTAPGIFEKALHATDTKIYQLIAGGMIRLTSEPELSSKIRAVSDNYIITVNGEIYKFCSPYFDGNTSISYSIGSGDIIKQQTLVRNTELSTRHFTTFEGEINFECEGIYLINMITYDGNVQIKSGSIINIDYIDPFVLINPLSNGTGEDEEIQLLAEISIFGSEDPNPNEYRLKWDFGDGTYSYLQNPFHRWSNAGIYNITLTVVDCYGNRYATNTTIEIISKEPQITGPFYFQGLEGQAVVLDVEVFDCILDEQFLSYTWYDDKGIQLSHSRNNSKPITILNDGEFIYRLEVEDQHGNVGTANITLLVEDIPPSVLISNYGYYGLLGGTMELNAYVFDNSKDIDNMKFEWTLYHGNETTIYEGINTGIRNIYTFNNFMSPIVCIGQIKVLDTLTNKSGVSNFRINNLIDDNRNNIPDDYEWMIAECGWEFNISVPYDDYDEDNLIDFYETNISHTNPNDPDTDGDGLYDGYDMYGIGERPFNTDPTKFDTDGDLLGDGFEIFGWSITSELLGEILVTSNPLKNDTDGEGLLDGDEFERGTNPRKRDTDSEGLPDNLDPFPTVKDADEDGLSDFLEFLIGTGLNNTDTDGDSLTDGQEVRGWGFRTNPLSADSDNDFLLDAEETNSYNYELKERMSLNDPVSLWFSKFIKKSISAQIAISIAFGEVSTEGDGYGILDVPDIEVIVTKKNANLELFRGNTNKSRYFTKVIDIKKIMDNRSLNYWGEYEVRINDTGAGCVLEQFEIGVSTYLNPNKPDYDKDKIMDGVEVDLLVNGTKRIDFEDIYTQNNLTTHYCSDPNGSYFLESGYYPGTFSFENVPIGGDPSAWVLNETGGTLNVIAELDGHKSIVEMNQTNSSSEISMTRLLTNPHQSGTIEWWWRTTDASHIAEIGIGNASVNFLKFRINNNRFEFNNGTWNEIGLNVSEDAWYHLSLVFECTTSNYRGLPQYSWFMHINGIEYGNFTFENQGSEIEEVWFKTKGLSNYLCYIDAISFSWDARYKIGENLQESIKVYNEISLEIPDIGTVYDARLSVEIESDHILLGNGTVIIKLIKEDINRKIADVFLINNIEHFQASTTFSFGEYFDLSDYLEYGLISRYTGKYVLKVKIYSTEISDLFNITHFYIDTDTFVQAEQGDTEAWITNPGKWDTDGDGLSDYYEIYGRKEEGLEPTNPINKDTDGDGTSDLFDRDPVRDLIIEISPIYGFHNSLGFIDSHPVLEITMSLSSGGFLYKFYSAKKRAHESKATVGSGLFTKKLYRKSYFDGTHGSVECHYYANIEDHWFSSPIPIKLGLYHMDKGLIDYDELLLKGTILYNVGFHGTTETFTISHGHRMAVRIRTIGLNKTNTIAIYDDNTVFNGHYQTKEHMNVIQLYVRTSNLLLFGTPFVRGANTIVIPTSLFKDTLLNKYVQNEEVYQTPLYDEDHPEYYEFISMPREGQNVDGASGEIDFMFIRFEVTRAEAVAILSLLLTCIVNATTNETAIKYKFASTKQNGFSAILMNLPLDVLGMVPWKYDFQDSAQGDQPRDWLQTLADHIVAVGEFIVGIFISIWEGIVNIVKIIGEFIGPLLLEFLDFLAYILWCIIRAVLLIFVWIMFSITLLFLIMANATIALTFVPIVAIFEEVQMIFNINSVKIDMPGFSFSTGYDVYIDNYEAFDIPVPYINCWFYLGTFKMIDITIKFWPPGLEFNTVNATYQEEEIVTSVEGKENICLNKNLDTSNGVDLYEFGISSASFIDGFFTSLEWWTFAIPFATGSISLSSDIPNIAALKYSLLVIAFGTYIAGFISKYFLADMKNDYEKFWYFLGAGIISIYTGIKFYDEGKYNEDIFFNMEKWKESIEDIGDSVDKLFKDRLKDIFKDLITLFVMKMLENLFSLYGISNDGEVDYVFSFFSDVLTTGSDVAGFSYKSIKDYKRIFEPLHILSGTYLAALEFYNRDLKIVSFSMILIGIIQLITSFVFLHSAVN